MASEDISMANSAEDEELEMTRNEQALAGGLKKLVIV